MLIFDLCSSLVSFLLFLGAVSLDDSFQFHWQRWDPVWGRSASLFDSFMTHSTTDWPFNWQRILSRIAKHWGFVGTALPIERQW